MISSLQELKSYIDNSFMSSPYYNQNMGDVVLKLGQKKEICSLINLIITDPKVLHAVASSSYIHYNGFDKIVLLSSANPQYKLRLHIWWPAQVSFPPENIHNHRWDFSSVILIGSYRNQEFQAAEEGFETYEYIYIPPEGRNHYSITPIGVRKIRCISDCIFTFGSYYTLTPSVFHRVISDRLYLTASLMLQGSTQNDTVVKVFSYNPIDKPESIDSSPLSIVALADKLRKLLDALERKSCSAPHFLDTKKAFVKEL